MQLTFRKVLPSKCSIAIFRPLQGPTLNVTYIFEGTDARGFWENVSYIFEGLTYRFGAWRALIFFLLSLSSLFFFFSDFLWLFAQLLSNFRRWYQYQYVSIYPNFIHDLKSYVFGYTCSIFSVLT